MPKRWELTIDGRLENLATIADFVIKAAQTLGLSDRATFYVQMAVDEACTNIIQHSYEGEGKGEIAILCELVDDDFVVTIRDHGRPFDPGAVPLPNLSASLAERQNEKLGLYFMRQLMDEVRFHFDVEGNELTMTKKIGR